MNERHNRERPTPKDFHFTVARVEREHGHVYIADGPIVWKLYLHPDGHRVTLVTGTGGGGKEQITPEKWEAMQRQVRAILGPELRSGRVTPDTD